MCDFYYDSNSHGLFDADYDYYNLYISVWRCSGGPGVSDLRGGKLRVRTESCQVLNTQTLHQHRSTSTFTDKKKFYTQESKSLSFPLHPRLSGNSPCDSISYLFALEKSRFCFFFQLFIYFMEKYAKNKSCALRHVSRCFSLFLYLIRVDDRTERGQIEPEKSK